MAIYKEVDIKDFRTLQQLLKTPLKVMPETQKIPAKSSLFIDSRVVISRESIRESGYTITRDPLKADYIVVDITKLSEGMIEQIDATKFNLVDRYIRDMRREHLSGGYGKVDDNLTDRKYRSTRDFLNDIVIMSYDNLISIKSLDIQRNITLDLSAMKSIESYLLSSDTEVKKMGITLATQATTNDMYFLSYLKYTLSSVPSNLMQTVAAKQLRQTLESVSFSFKMYVSSPESIQHYKEYVQSNLGTNYDVAKTVEGKQVKVNFNVNVEVI